MIPIKQYVFDLNPQPAATSKKAQKQMAKGKEQKPRRPLVRSVKREKQKLAAKISNIVEDSKAKLQQMMKLDKPEVEFNTDLFLKTQKQKQKQYAKDLHRQFQQSKNKRQDELLKRQKQANQKISENKVEIKTKQKFYDELPTITKYPIQIQNQFAIESHQPHKVKQFVSGLDVAALRKSEEECFGGKYKWERLERLCDDVTKLKFIQTNKDGEILLKNQFISYPGHENLLSILGMVAMRFQILRRITLGDQKLLTDNVYPFLFYNGNRKVACLVDNYIQCEKLQLGDLQVYSHCKDKNTSWVSLFEKAYRKIFEIGSLHDVCRNVLGVFPEIVKISSKAIIKENFFQVLRFYLTNGGLLGALRKGEIANSSSYQGQVYPIKEIKTGESLAQSTLQVINCWHGKSLFSDGKQFLSLADFLFQFNRIVLVKGYPAQFTGIQLPLNFYSFGIPASNNPEWVKGNQYLINMNKSSNVRIVLQSQCLEMYGFTLLKCQPDDVKVVAINLDKLVCTVRSTMANQASYAGNLEKGSYVLIPFSAKKSEDSFVFMKLEVFIKEKDGLHWGKAKIAEVNYKEVDRNGERVKGELDFEEKFEKPRVRPIFQKDDKTLFSDHLTNKVLPPLSIQNSNFKPQDIFIPGFCHRLIVNENVVVEEKQSEQRPQKSLQAPSPELDLHTRQQQLKLLLGLDAYTEDVDQEMMSQALEHLEQEVDFANFELGDDGFERSVEYMMEQPRIVTLNLKGNQLTDRSIVQLCYFLQKYNHNELRKLILQDNQIGKMGYQALKGLVKRIKVKQVVLFGNKGIKVEDIKAMSRLQ